MEWPWSEDSAIYLSFILATVSMWVQMFVWAKEHPREQACHDSFKK